MPDRNGQLIPAETVLTPDCHTWTPWRIENDIGFPANLRIFVIDRH
ncbi:MAG: hypothetical protein HGB01_08590 [Chlorobiaceae bacterium]|nr:hypothetical protein [Chlorobiaceae bacterium]